jgi:iron complex transport system substrate-binding protein
MRSPNHTITGYFIALVLVLGCATRPADDSKPEHVDSSPKRETATSYIEITDTYDHVVKLEKPAERIASLAPGFTEVLFAIGCKDRIKIRDNWSNFPSDATALPAVDGLEPSPAIIAGYDPDLVLLCFKNARYLKSFDQIGLPVAMLEPKTFDQVAEDIVKLGVLCGREERAAELAASMLQVKDEVVHATKGTDYRPLVYVELDGADPARPWTAGPGSFIDELLTLAGGRNVASDAGSSYAQVTAESIIRSDPDLVLLLGNKDADPEAAVEMMKNRSGWSRMSAIRKGRVISGLDRDLLSRPGPRLAEGLRLLYRALHREGKTR